MKPQFKHDCDDCAFLGRSKDGTHDLYFHDSDCECKRTIIARYGNNGPEYKSGMIFGQKKIDPHLTEAYDYCASWRLLK